MPLPDQRIDVLQARIAHQEKAIADLSDMVTAQWKKIERLERQLQRLDEEVQALDTQDVPVTKPPHY